VSELDRERRIVFRTGLITALALALPWFVGYVAVAFSYDGYCYGFTDGRASCSFIAAVQNEMFLPFLLMWIFVPISAGTFGWSYAAYRWKTVSNATQLSIRILAGTICGLIGWLLVVLPMSMGR
jgi:hypothetical protein